jgi:hypothetical protein
MFKAGNHAKVTIGTDTVVGMGNWKLNGITVDLLDSTSFGDTAKQFMTGLLDYGTVTFGGLYDPADSTGQTILFSAQIHNSTMNNIRFYVDNTSYWIPNCTVASGGLSAASISITSVTIGIDKSGLGTIEFTGKCSGPMLLV